MRSTLLKGIVGATIVALSLSGTAHAATTLFEDDFQSYAYGTPSSLAPNWVVNPGTIDVIGTGPFDWYGSGKYIDLNGTPDSPAKITSVKTFDLVKGYSYQLEFDYGVNKYYNNAESLGFGVGGNVGQIDIPAGEFVGAATLTYFVFKFTAIADGLFSIFFEDLNKSPGDLGGPVIDNVRFSVVPIPAAGLLLGAALAGLAVFGGRLRRRPQAT